MAFDVNRFSGEMAKNGIAKTSDFEVEVTGVPTAGGGGGFSVGNLIRTVTSAVSGGFPPSIGGLFGGGAGTAQSLTLRIDSIQFPGRNINNVDYLDYGAPYKVGGKTNYGNSVAMTVICSPNLVEREFFLAWQDLIGGDHRTGTTNFDLGYYEEYVCKQGFQIYQLDPNGNRTRVIKLIDSYPSAIGDMSASWASTEVVRMPVTMSYRYFEEEDVASTPFSLTGGIENIASTVNAVRNLPAQIKGRSRAALDRAGIPRF